MIFGRTTESGKTVACPELEDELLLEEEELLDELLEEELEDELLEEELLDDELDEEELDEPPELVADPPQADKTVIREIIRVQYRSLFLAFSDVVNMIFPIGILVPA